MVATVREMFEESDGCIKIKEKDLRYGGVIVFINDDGVSDFRVHMFYGLDIFTGLPPSTGVMQDPTWFDISSLGKLDMMPADRFFLPMILSDRKVIRGKVIFEKGFKGVKEFFYEEISSHEIQTLLGEIQP